MSDFEDRMQVARDKVYFKAGVSATYYPVAGSFPASKSITILKDEQRGSGENHWENSAQSSVIWIRKSELVIVRKSGTANPVPEKEKIEFGGQTWRVVKILEDTENEWRLQVEKDL